MASEQGLDKLPPVRRKGGIRQVPGRPPGKGAAPGTIGQAPFIATDAQRAKVRVLIAAGFTNESIAVVTQIPLATLERHFPFELKEGKTIVDAQILGGIVEQAIEGDKTMRIFYAKSRANWRDMGPAADAQANALFSIQIGTTGGDHAPEIKVTAIPRTIEGEAEDSGEGSEDNAAPGRSR